MALFKVTTKARKFINGILIESDNKLINLVCLLLVIVIAVSCGNRERDKYDTMSYYDVLTALLIENTDLPTISKSTKISQQDLVRMKYGIIAENEELTIFLRDLKCAFDTNDDSEIEGLLDEHAISVDNNIIGKPLAIEKYKEQEYLNNERFQESIVKIGGHYYGRKVKDYFEEFFSTWEVLKNAWRFTDSSYDEYYAKFEEGLLKIFSLDEFYVILNKRVTSYAQMLITEHNYLYGTKVKPNELVVISQMDNMGFQLDEGAKDNFLQTAVDASSSIWALTKFDIISFILEMAVENIFTSEKPYAEIEEEIHTQIEDYITSLDIWVLTDLNNITRGLK